MTRSASSARPSTVGTWRTRSSRAATQSPVSPRVEAELGGAPRQAVADPLAASLDGRLVDVVEDDLAAGLERDLGDPRAHRPGADDADDGRQIVAGRRRGALAHQTDLIDSNGWRQSAQ